MMDGWMIEKKKRKAGRIDGRKNDKNEKIKSKEGRSVGRKVRKERINTRK